MDNEQKNELQTIAKEAFSTVPNTYANGFINGIGGSDTYIVFQINGQSSLVLNISPSMARTLGESLLTMVEAYEKESGHTVPPMRRS